MALRSQPVSAICVVLLCALVIGASAPFVMDAQEGQAPASQTTSEHASQANTGAPREKAAGKPSPEEELQRALNEAGTDRAALVRNLESFLLKYPDYPNRTRIYRALVEASLQLQDDSRAGDYAERMVALNPNDMSILLLAIELLERHENEAGFRRAVNYSSRVLELVEKTNASARSPRVSVEQWDLQRKSDLANTYFLRGDLYLKLKDYPPAKKDLQTSYDLFPSASAAQRLGETAELQKDLDGAIQEYARAFALAEGKNGNVSRQEIRKKIGNVWRLAHGSDDGLGEYLLRSYDEVAQPPLKSKPARNQGIREISEFTLRKSPDGALYSLKETKGRVLVVNFWTTWCGPCHALEPIFARVASEFRSLPTAVFLSANCDEDETLVGAYLQTDKMSTEVVFADGLDRLFSVNSFPTVIVIDREGKIAFRSNGFQPDTFERDLLTAVRRAMGEPATSY